MNQDFKPVICSRCGAVIWAGISWVGFARRLDKATLTIEEEISKRLVGLMSYEAHRTRVSFEAVERSANRIRWAKADAQRVILADHKCSSFRLFETIENAPDYWKKPVKVSVMEGCPF